MVDALASGASGGNPVEVQVLFRPPNKRPCYQGLLFKLTSCGCAIIAFRTNAYL